MKVTCQSCQAKYTIADEKVRGKVAKIRCKKCGTTIIVNGTDSTGGAVADYTHQGGADEQWSVLVADGDQRTVTLAQVTELFAAGTISLETPAWKDGMADWLPIAQIDSLRTIVEQGPRSMTADPGLALASLLPDASAAAVPAVVPSPAEPLVAKSPGPAARINAPEPAARRRPRGGSTDLFGAAVQDDVMTSASADPSSHMHSGADKPTGARNENSVLFSLAALTGGGPAPSPAKPTAHADKEPVSSKADLRSLMGSDTKPAAKSKLDDIINLSGGGVYSPAMLTAPVLAPPPVELSSAADSVGMSAKPKGKGLVAMLIGGVVLVAVAAVAFTTMNSKAEADKALAAASASAKIAEEALAAALASAEAMKQAAAQAPEPTASSDTPAQAPTVLAPGQAAPKPESEKKVAAAKAADRPEKEKPAAPLGAAALGVPPPAPAAPAPPPAAAGGGSGDFDRAAALSTLSAAATAAQSCRKPDGPTGSGRIAVTFANSGQATTATVEGPPFAGTPVGGCVAARFRGTHVPPYGGAPITVHKTFNIN